MIKDEQSEPQPTSQPAKEPYEKPAFRFERVFETRALTCGKIQTTGGACSLNRKFS
jgi:hypothetical protein